MPCAPRFKCRLNCATAFQRSRAACAGLLLGCKDTLSGSVPLQPTTQQRSEFCVLLCLKNLTPRNWAGRERSLGTISLLCAGKRSICAVHACKYALAPCAPTKQDKTGELQGTASGIKGFGGVESKQNENNSSGFKWERWVWNVFAILI